MTLQQTELSTNPILSEILLFSTSCLIGLLFNYELCSKSSLQDRLWTTVEYQEVIGFVLGECRPEICRPNSPVDHLQAASGLPADCQPTFHSISGLPVEHWRRSAEFRRWTASNADEQNSGGVPAEYAGGVPANFADLTGGLQIVLQRSTNSPLADCQLGSLSPILV